MINEKLFMAITTYGELHSTGKYNNYDIIEKFVEYVIKKECYYKITEVNVGDSLKSIFGFINLPRAIINRVLQIMLNKKLLAFDGEKDAKYYIKTDLFDEVVDANNEIEYYDTLVNDNISLIKSALFEWYVKYLNRELKEDDKKEIVSKYYSFISNSVIGNDSDILISNFIIDCSINIRDLIQQNINSYIIFQGLNYEISDLDLKITDDIKLFFDMEIIFDLMGYNGDYYKIRADEMMHYIDEINQKRKGTIKLYYFKDTKDYISQFFDKAKKIKYENAMNEYNNINTAMEYIFDNTKTLNDVTLLKNELFVTLKNRYKFSEENSDFYSQEFSKLTLNKEYNIPQKVDKQSCKSPNNGHSKM